jgi:A/G-specific adenine glycosylase
VRDYTQAIMDLGATVCVRRRPLCPGCPLARGCAARRGNRQHELPAPRARAPRGQRSVYMVVALCDSGEVWLERRPDGGVWGGLWCLPEFATASAAGAFARDTLGARAAPGETLAGIEHGFTHFDLRITPLLVRCARPGAVMEAPAGLWYNIRQPARVGLPAPITALLAGLARESLFDAPRAH